MSEPNYERMAVQYLIEDHRRLVAAGDVAPVRAELESVKRELEAARNNESYWEAVAQKYREQSDEDKGLIEGQIAEIEMLRGVAEKQGGELQPLREEIRGLQESLQARGEELRELKANGSASEYELGAVERERDEAYRELENAACSFTKVEAERDRLVTEVNELSASYTDLTKRAGDMESECAEAAEQIERLVRERDEALDRVPGVMVDAERSSILRLLERAKDQFIDEPARAERSLDRAILTLKSNFEEEEITVVEVEGDD